MITRVFNSLEQSANNTFLSDSVASGTNVLPWINANQFYASWAVQLGKTGEEKSEVLLLSASTPAGTAGTTTANTAFDHPADTPVYAIKYDQVVFKVSTAGTAGTAAVITDGTVTITPDSFYTQFDHTTGASTYAYKAYFQNSVTTDVSDDSDWLTPSGYTFYSLNKLRERAKDKLFSASYIKSDSIVDDWINEWLESMNSAAIAVNEDFSIGTANVAVGTSGLGTISSTDFKSIRKLEVSDNGGVDWYTATRMDVTDFSSADNFDSTDPYFYMYGDSVFGVKPEPSASGTARIIYYKLPTVLSNETDELPVSMRGYSKSFVDYCMAQAYYLDGKDTTGDRFMLQADKELDKFKGEISPRTKTGIKYIKIVEPVSADSFELY